MFWPLMKNCITAEDRYQMIDFIATADRFTNGPKVRQFEEEWSKWLGCEYSLYVSSGSTANLLLISAVKEKYNLKKGDKVIVPAMTWVTNVSPIFQLGLEPVFCDINITDFGFDLEHLKEIKQEHNDIKVVFVTHLFGIPAKVDLYKEIFPEAIFLEDACESHGATHEGKKVGTLGVGSTFSFYFGHHMTTVEGGFVCTDDKDLYNIMRMKRSHGMAREALPEKFEEYKKEYPDVHPQFLFMTDGYNLRSMEINAVLGLSQLKRLDDSIKRRQELYGRFLELIAPYKSLIKPTQDGNSSYCLPFICKTAKMKEQLEVFLRENGVETRPLCSGNLLRQPFLNQYKIDRSSGVDFLHDHGFFIGNNHLITDEEFHKLSALLSEYLPANEL